MPYVSTGSAAVAYRAVIDGAPISGVSVHTMVSDVAVPARKDGLKLKGQTFTVNADILTAKLDVPGLTLSFVDVDNVWSGLFDLLPTATTWLTATIDATTTGALQVLSTEGFPSAGTIWVDGEAITYSGITGTLFTGLTRGALSPDGTQSAQWHYNSNDGGPQTRSPEVTNWPALWEGRRVFVYRYDEGDLPSSDGTPCYRGVIASAPSYDGKTWTVQVDHVTSLLEMTIGQDLSTAVQPRGINYTDDCQFTMLWAQSDTSGAGGSNITTGTVRISGFFENNDDWCTELSSELATSFATYGGTGSLVAISEGPTGWHLQYVTADPPRNCWIQIQGAPTLTPGTLSVSGPPPIYLDPPLGRGGGTQPYNTIGFDPIGVPVTPGGFGFAQFSNYDLVVSALVAGATYYFLRPGVGATDLNTTQGGVPRGVIPQVVSSGTATRTFYVAGADPISPLVTMISVETGGSGGSSNTFPIESVNIGERSLTIAPIPGRPIVQPYFSDALPNVRLGLSLSDPSLIFTGGSSVADLLDYVTAEAPQVANLGILPPLRPNDFNLDRWHATFDSLPYYVTQRMFTQFSPIAMGDVVREELKAAAGFMSLDSTGKIIPALVYLPAASELSAVSRVDETNYLTGQSRITHEVSGLGQVNQVQIQTGYNPPQDQFVGPTYSARDVAAYGQSPSSRIQQIAQKSQYIGDSGSNPINATAALQMAQPLFGALAGSYATDTLDAARVDAVEVGQPISFNNPYLSSQDPSSAAPKALLGVIGRVGIVTSKATGAYSPTTQFTALSTRQPIAGYAPGGIISAMTNTSGNTWTLTIASTYMPIVGGTQTHASDFFFAADIIQVIQFGVVPATPLQGTVGSASVDTVTVTFGSTWTPGSDTWYLTIGNSDAINTSQTRFCETADAAGVIDTGGPNLARARVFGS